MLSRTKQQRQGAEAKAKARCSREHPGGRRPGGLPASNHTRLGCLDGHISLSMGSVRGFQGMLVGGLRRTLDQLGPTSKSINIHPQPCSCFFHLAHFFPSPPFPQFIVPYSTSFFYSPISVRIIRRARISSSSPSRTEQPPSPSPACHNRYGLPMRVLTQHGCVPAEEFLPELDTG